MRPVYVMRVEAGRALVVAVVGGIVAAGALALVVGVVVLWLRW